MTKCVAASLEGYGVADGVVRWGRGLKNRESRLISYVMRRDRELGVRSRNNCYGEADQRWDDRSKQEKDVLPWLRNEAVWHWSISSSTNNVNYCPIGRRRLVPNIGENWRLNAR